MEKAISIRCTGAAAIDIEDLSPFQDDIKTMTPSTLKKLENVIISQGFSEPIAVWPNDGRNWILNGHQRHTALQSLRSKGWFVPPVPVALVDAADEDEARKKVLTLASQFGDFNQDHLLEFVAKARLDTDWIRNNARLAAGDFKWPTLKTDDGGDDVPSTPAIVCVRRGEVYHLGAHRLMCGDATSFQEMQTLMKGDIADMLFTDPPYGIAYKSNAWDSEKSEVLAQRTDREIENDHSTEVGINALYNADKFIAENAHMFVWCRWSCFQPFVDALKEIANIKSVIVWDKGGPGLGDLECSYGDSEWAIHAMRGRRPLAERQNCVWQVNRMKGLQMVHPTQKPVDLCTRAILNATRNDEIVLDLFGGSGSTLISCEQNQRSARVMELDPLYCGVILDRWQEFSGKIAHRDDGETWDSIKATRNG